MPPTVDRAGAPGEAGTAVVLALIFVTVLGATAASLVPLAMVERLMAAAALEGADCRYAAEAVANYAIAELQARSQWDGALDGSSPAGFTDGTRTPRLGGSRRLDLAALGASLPTEPGAWGANRPRWLLFSWGPVRMLSPSLRESPIYVAVWVADDERDGDQNPQRDSNGRLSLRADAFGPTRAHYAVQVSLARQLPAPAALRLLDWRVP